MSDQSKGFWSSIPGILTGIAALITAVTGLYIAINGDNTTSQPATTDVKVTLSPSAQATESTIRTEKRPAHIIQQDLRQQPAVELRAEKSSKIITSGDKTPFPETGALVDCSVFPTVNTVSSLMSWSNYYHKQIIAANGIKKPAIDPCNQAIDQRGMAHCKEPGNSKVRKALLETLTLCRAAGVEWTNIKHSTIIGQE